jgi:hypothetical protein
VLDARGQVIWSGAFAPGARELAWAGTDARGAAVSNGVYVARLATNGTQGKSAVAELRITLAR